MSAQILSFKPKKRPERIQAMRWLVTNAVEFPKKFDGYTSFFGIGDDLFHGWRFVRGVDGIIYFANCIGRGITEGDVLQFIRRLQAGGVNE